MGVLLFYASFKGVKVGWNLVDVVVEWLLSMWPLEDNGSKRADSICDMSDMCVFLGEYHISYIVGAPSGWRRKSFLCLPKDT